MKAFYFLVLVFLLSACAGSNPVNHRDPGSLSSIQQAINLIGPDWPPSEMMLATTDGEIYLGNLNSQIDGITSNPRLNQRVAFQLTLAGLLYQRFQIEGRLEDAEKANEILESVHNSPSFRPSDHLLYAKVLLGFHDFSAAETQIAEAESRGANTSEVNASRHALQRTMQLLPAVSVDAIESPETYTSAVQSSAQLINTGHPYRASLMLREAQSLYRDSSPFPVAWIHLQQGILFLRHGKYEQARVFFSSAYERFPQYYLATEHLAETEGLLGNHHRAVELYKIVTAQNNHPAFWHGLAEAERASGNQEQAEIAAQKAAEGYARLLKTHPLMYADHAVGYYLDIGDNKQALKLADLNFAERRDVSARLVLAEALMANGQRSRACEQVTALNSAGFSPPEITQAGAELASCIV